MRHEWGAVCEGGFLDAGNMNAGRVNLPRDCGTRGGGGYGTSIPGQVGGCWDWS